MSDSTDQLIATLSQSASAVKPVRVAALWGRWVLGCVLYTAGLVAITGMRADLGAAFTQPLFAAEIAVLAALIISAVGAAALLSFPDRHQQRLWVWTPVTLSVLLIGILAIAWQHSTAAAPAVDHGAECTLCISLYGLLPGAWLFWQMRKLASTHGALAGATASIAAFGMGALALRLNEPTDYMPHLLLWHYLPMLAVIVVGLALGRWLLKW